MILFSCIRCNIFYYFVYNFHFLFDIRLIGRQTVDVIKVTFAHIGVCPIHFQIEWGEVFFVYLW